MTLCALEEPAKSRIAAHCADSSTHHAFCWIASILPDKPEQCTSTTVKNSRCPRCEICPDEKPGTAHSPRLCHPQQYFDLAAMAAEEMGLWKFADCPHFTDAHAGCNIYSCMNIAWLHQLLKGLFKDHTWDWIVGFLKDIYGQDRVWTRLMNNSP